jgi:hypothetical protein
MEKEMGKVYDRKLLDPRKYGSFNKDAKKIG